MEATFYISAFVTLFVVIDPIGLAPLFVTITQGMPSKKRRTIALRPIFVGAILLTLFGLLGEAILGFAGMLLAALAIQFVLDRLHKFGLAPL